MTWHSPPPPRTAGRAPVGARSTSGRPRRQSPCQPRRRWRRAASSSSAWRPRGASCPPPVPVVKRLIQRQPSSGRGKGGRNAGMVHVSIRTHLGLQPVDAVERQGLERRELLLDAGEEAVLLGWFEFDAWGVGCAYILHLTGLWGGDTPQHLGLTDKVTDGPGLGHGGSGAPRSTGGPPPQHQQPPPMKRRRAWAAPSPGCAAAARGSSLSGCGCG